MAEGDESFHKLNTKSKDTSGYKEEIGDVIRYHRRQSELNNMCQMGIILTVLLRISDRAAIVFVPKFFPLENCKKYFSLEEL